jgi:signal transduction histidine kinase/sensor domain CHASE-containing protein
MKLRAKTLLIITATFAVLLVLVYAASRAILLNNFVRLEEQLAEENLSRAVNALDAALDSLERSNADWAHWTDTYNFVQGDENREEYQTINLGLETFQNLNLNLAIYLNAERDIVFGGVIEPGTTEIASLPQGIEPLFTPDSPLVDLPGLLDSAAGVIMLPDGPALVVSHNILTGERTGPPQGTLIRGRYLNQTEIDALAESTRLSLEVYPVDAGDLPGDFGQAGAALRDQPVAVNVLANGRIAAYTVIDDLYGNPALFMRIDMERSVFQQGEQGIVYFLAALVLAGFSVGMIVLLLLENFVLSRLDRLNRDVTAIGSTGRASDRLTVDGADELSSLGHAINRTLGALESAQLKRQQSEARLEAIVRGAPVVFFALDGQGHILVLEGKKLHELGFDTRSYIGRSIHEPAMHQALPQIATAFEQARHGQAVRITAGLREAIFDIWCEPYFSGEGEIGAREFSGVIGVATEITERVQAQAQIEQAREAAESANRAKSLFLANMSHELRTPLNAIIGYSELVAEECQDSELDHLVRDLGKIQAAGNHLLELINNILDLSKIEAGKMDLDLTQFDLTSLINQVQMTIAPLAARNENHLSVDVAPDLPEMFADQTKVRQVLINLLNNANKFTQHGRVNLRARSVLLNERPAVCIEINDTGIGMTPAEIDRLFADFSQADASTTRRYGGTGLGLSISKRFTELMGGRIDVESAPGEGSTFRVHLPVHVEPLAVPVDNRIVFEEK